MVILILLVFLQADVEACGGNFKDPSGSFVSPGYPPYNSSLDCLYVIRARQGERVTLTFEQFEQFDIQSGRCIYYFIELRDGDSARSERFLAFPCIMPTTGFQKRSFGNSIYLRIHADGLQIRFRVNYTFGIVKNAFFLIPVASNTGPEIHRIDVETKSTTAIPGLSVWAPFAVDFDPIEGRLYWTDTGVNTLNSAYLDGSGQTSLRNLNNEKESSALGIAVDPVSRLVFYTEEENGVIGMMTLSGFWHRTIIPRTGLDRPRAIVLDTINGVMFWSEWNETPARIKRANYDGTDRRTIVSLGLRSPNALALDVSNDRLYWVDGGSDTVEYSDLNGNGRIVLYRLSAASLLFGLAHLDQYLFVINWTSSGPRVNESHILRLSTDGRSGERILTGGFQVNDIHAYTEDGWQKGPNGCSDNNGGCSHFCIPLPGNASKCMCPDAPTDCVNEKLPTATTSEVPTTATTTPLATTPPTTTTTMTSTPQTTTTTSSTSHTTTTTSSTSQTTTTMSSTPQTTTTSSTQRISTTTAQPITVPLNGPDLFDTNGSHGMTLTCDPDARKPVLNLTWSVTCVRHQGRMCVWTPKAPEDDGKEVTCFINYADGQSAFGCFTVKLNYPPLAPPTILGYKHGDVLQAGDSVTMSCQVRDGKPLVTSVFFSCSGHSDSVTDIRSDSEVQSLLIINPLKAEEDGLRCVCTAEWKRSEWYALSATRILSIKGINDSSAPQSGPPVSVIAGAVGGFCIILIVVIVIVVAAFILRRRANARNTRPDWSSRARMAEPTQTPQRAVDGLGVLGHPNLYGVRDVTCMTFRPYDDIFIWEENKEITSDGYLLPVVVSGTRVGSMNDQSINSVSTDRQPHRVESTNPDRHGSSVPYLHPLPSTDDLIGAIYDPKTPNYYISTV